MNGSQRLQRVLIDGTVGTDRTGSRGIKDIPERWKVIFKCSGRRTMVVI